MFISLQHFITLIENMVLYSEETIVFTFLGMSYLLFKLVHWVVDGKHLIRLYFLNKKKTLLNSKINSLQSKDSFYELREELIAVLNKITEIESKKIFN